MSSPNVLFVGLGPLGKMIIGDFVTRSLGRVAGVVDVNPRLVGQRVRDTIPGAGDSSVLASIREALDAAGGRARVDAAVVATSSDLSRCMPTLRELLALGMPIVSTCEELLWPWLRHEAAAKELDAMCAAHGGRLVGTGVNPGFMMDTLPVVLTAVSRRVERVHVERVQDASTRRVPFQQKIGAALSEADFAARVKEGVLRHVGLGESMHFVSHYLGLGVTKWDETLGPVHATRALSCALGEIKPGGISGVRQVATGWNGRGEAVITLEFQAAIGQENPRDRLVVEGEPRLEMVIPGAVQGDIATSSITLNMIPRVVEARPGLHTMATLSLPRFVR